MRHSLKLLLTTTVLTVSSSFAADQPLLPNSSNDATDSSVVTAEKQGVSPMKHSKVLELFRSVPSPFFGFFPESEDLWCTGYLDVSSIAALETAFASAGKKIAKNKTETYIERLNRIRIFYTKISFLTNHDERIRFLGVRPSGNNSDEDLALLNEALGNKNITFWNDFGFLILEGVVLL